MTEHLLIFARFPVVGECKTRLIQTLGATGATDLYVAMMKHTLAWADCVEKLRNMGQQKLQVLVHFSGGDQHSMQNCFGGRFEYVPQIGGDLGDKLRFAILSSFGQGVDRVVVVGTDCPELDEQMVATAFRRLESHDVCFAPAKDGGYTLIGLTRAAYDRCPSLLSTLFEGIPWGTETVLGQSLKQLSTVCVSISLLPTLGDVDSAEDLPAGLDALAGAKRPMPELTVIVPTYGIEKQLSVTLDSVQINPVAEVIVVAAGETAESVRVASEHQVQLLTSLPGRALQMNAGANLARAEWLLFLHADSQLPTTYARDLSTAVRSNANIVGGAFELRIESQARGLRWIERGVHLRSKLWKLPYGDQAIFVRRSAFEQLGGYHLQPIMEDYEFVRRLRRMGQLEILPSPVTTSARRWERHGIWKTTLINQMMIIGYKAGVSPQKLAAFYRR